jgi:hypothetical protein
MHGRFARPISGGTRRRAEGDASVGAHLPRCPGAAADTDPGRLAD